MAAAGVAGSMMASILAAAPRSRSEGFVGSVRGAERIARQSRMFQPTQHDVRGFFVDARRKRGDGLPLTPLETIAADWIEAHPEYRADLADADSARAATYSGEDGRENPFLHLSMHLSISEQVSIDQPRRHPRGVRVAGGAPRLGARGAARGDGVPRPHALGSAAQRPAARRRRVRRMRAAAGDALTRPAGALST